MRTPYWTKKGHLGMTRAELLEKLNGGGVVFVGEVTENNDAIIYKDDFGAAIEFDGNPNEGCDETTYNKIKQWCEDLNEKMKNGSTVTFYYSYDYATSDINSGVYQLVSLNVNKPDEYTLINGSYNYGSIFNISTNGGIGLVPYNGKVVLGEIF